MAGQHLSPTHARIIVLAGLSLSAWLWNFLPTSGWLGKTVIDERSAWAGGRPVSDGGFIIESPSGAVGLAEVRAPIEPNQLYRYTVDVAGAGELKLDFIGGGYDSLEQEIGDFNGSDLPRRMGGELWSGNAPPEVLARIFFQGGHDRYVSRVRIVHLRGVDRAMRVLLAALPLGLALAIAGRFLLARRRARPRWRFGTVTLAALLFYFFCANTSTPGGDNRWYLPGAASLLATGTLELAGPFEPGMVTTPSGHLYNFYPPGPSILSAPFVIVARMLGLGAPLSEPLAALLAALTVSLVFTISRRLGLRRGSAALTAAVFAIATSHYSLHSKSIWSHNFGSLLLCVALWLLFSPPRAFGRGWLPVVLFVGYLCRPEFALISAACLVALWLRGAGDRPLAVRTMLSLTVMLLVFTAWSSSVYDALLPPYFRGTRLGIDGEFFHVLAGQLISPSRGLFVFNPVLILFPLGAVLVFRQGATRSRSVLRPFAVLALGSLPLLATFPHWWGGWCYGPRLHATFLPLMFVFATIGFRAAMGWGSKGLRTALWTLAVLAVGFGIFVHARGANDPVVQEWSWTPVSVDDAPDRVFDWSDPQWLRR